MKKRDSLRLSLPQRRAVRGYTVTRAPLGRFLEALRLAGDFPDELARSVMPGADARALLAALASRDAKLLWGLVGRALKIAPEQTLRFVAALCAIDADRLLNDPAVGLDGLCEIVEAWAEVNNIEDFFHRASALAAAWRTLTGRKAGSSASSPARSPSA